MKSRRLQQGEVLILSDGRILAHNITPELAKVLAEIDPKNQAMALRALPTPPVLVSGPEMQTFNSPICPHETRTRN
jgi:hypothetical protein